MDIEPGFEPRAKRARSACSTSLRVAAFVIIGVILSLFVAGLSAPDAQIKVHRSEEGLGTNNTSIWLNGLDKRDEAYEKRFEKGHWLFCIMNMNVWAVEPQNERSEFGKLKENGWSFSRDDFKNQAAMNQNWISVDNNHDESGGMYQNIFNLVDGVLIADVNFLPDYYIGMFGQPNVQAPKLKQWSDVMFHNYQELQRQTGQQGKDLEHFFQDSIENEVTVNTIRAARNGGDPIGPERNPPSVSLSSFPSLAPVLADVCTMAGWEWQIWERGAHAIMGTPNGCGVAYFLAQHKEALGMRTVERVRAFNCYDPGSPKFAMCLYFHVADGPLMFWGDW